MSAMRILLLPLVLLAGCATTGEGDPRDPFEGFNRGVYKFNDTVDGAILRPAAEVYRDFVPRGVRDRVRNFFGNLGDLAPRAVEALAGADVIVCEDTRRTRTLLMHAGVRGPRRIVANEHTEAATAAHVAELLAGGAIVAVVTDAGTPGISDPGARLVRAAIDGDHDVTVVPGPSAAVANRFRCSRKTARSTSTRGRRPSQSSSTRRRATPRGVRVGTYAGCILRRSSRAKSVPFIVECRNLARGCAARRTSTVHVTTRAPGMT